MAEPQIPELAIDGPIPGQHLTSPLGDRSWQRPPQYATPEEAIEYYSQRILDPAVSDGIIDVLKLGIPITTIANSVQLAGVMEGKHSIDVGVLIMPVLVELIELVAENAGVEYIRGTEEIESEELPETKFSVVIDKLKKQQMKEEEQREEEVEEEEEPLEEEVEEPTGLMSRRVS